MECGDNAPYYVNNDARFIQSVFHYVIPINANCEFNMEDSIWRKDADRASFKTHVVNSQAELCT